MQKRHRCPFFAAANRRLSTGFSRGWQARKQMLTPAQLASPLIARPYDFRHAGVSWRLNARTPAPLVAESAGHTVEVLLRIYAHCIDGDDERWFGPMDDALGQD